jgi:NAD(P)-dependent dehydrogenase (short-subunit alcohol dehydrogenase family)
MALKPDLSGQAILITGAARGLGRSMAGKLADCGARLALLDVDEAGGRATAEALNARGAQAFHYTVDV